MRFITRRQRGKLVPTSRPTAHVWFTALTWDRLGTSYGLCLHKVAILFRSLTETSTTSIRVGHLMAKILHLSQIGMEILRCGWSEYQVARRRRWSQSRRHT